MINTELNLGLFDTNLIIIIAVKNSELLSLFTGLMSLSVTKEGQLMADWPVQAAWRDIF